MTTRQRFSVYQRPTLWPEGDILTLDIEQGILSRIRDACIIEQQLFSPGEVFVVAALLENAPNYCPYEVILSEVTGRSIEKCRARLDMAYEEDATDAAMRPTRNMMGRIRIKLHPFDITVRSMVHTGYVLVPLKRREGTQE